MPDKEEAKCPFCQGNRVREYLYGHYSVVDEKKYILHKKPGDTGNPRFHCDECGAEWGEARE